MAQDELLPIDEVDLGLDLLLEVLRKAVQVSDPVDADTLMDEEDVWAVLLKGLSREDLEGLLAAAAETWSRLGTFITALQMGLKEGA